MHTHIHEQGPSRIRALNNDIVALYGNQGIDDTLWHQVSTLPTESAFLVVGAIDYLKNSMWFDDLVKKMDELVQLRWHLDAQLLQRVAQGACSQKQWGHLVSLAHRTWRTSASGSPFSYHWPLGVPD